MSRWLKTLAVAVLATLVFSATSTARPRAPGAMHVTVAITSSGMDEVALPGNVAVRAGGTVTLVFRNHTTLFHTFTVPGLGINRLIAPAHGTKATVTRITFIAPYGVYTWHCVLCPSSAHPHTHWMGGKIYAIIAA
jgi:plastocyanin